MATYYTLVCREKGSSQWFPQFGDYSRADVAGELRELRRDWPRGTQWKIVKSQDTQKSVDDAIARLGVANPRKGRKSVASAAKGAARAADRLVRARGSLRAPPGYFTEAEIYWEMRGLSLFVNWRGHEMYFQGDDAYYVLEALGVDPDDVSKIPSLFEVPEPVIDEYAHLGWDRNPGATSLRGASKADLLDAIYGSTFLMAYFEAMLWAETADDGDEGDDRSWDDKGYTVDDIETKSLAKLINDADRFLAMPGVRDALWGLSKKAQERAGHDLWLTRQGHGSGYWDGDWPEPDATVLTEAAKRIGECFLYSSGGKIRV